MNNITRTVCMVYGEAKENLANNVKRNPTNENIGIKNILCENGKENVTKQEP